MESHFSALIFVVVAVTLQAGSAHKMQCAGQDMKPKSEDKSLFHNMQTCTDDLKKGSVDKTEFKRGPGCIQYCTLKKDNIFDTSGHYNETALKEVAHAIIPTDELATRLIKEVTDCMAKIKKDTTEDEKDFHCDAHKGAVCCIMMAWKKTCIKEYHEVMDEACK